MHTLEKTVHIKFVFFLQCNALLAIEYYLTDVVAAVNKFTMKIVLPGVCHASCFGISLCRCEIFN